MDKNGGSGISETKINKTSRADRRRYIFSIADIFGLLFQNRWGLIES
jgi:hypothetical protein